MSLINDALKRTQQSARATQPARLPDLELRPLEPNPLAAQRGDGAWAKRILWLVVVVVVALNVALWLVFKDRGNEAEVAARVADTESVTPVPAAPATTPEPVPAPPAVEPLAPAPAVASAAVVSSNAAAPVVEPVPAPAVSEAPAVVARPEFKLKTIVRHPVRPSAMINNRVLFVGDKVEGYTVTAIAGESVTLVRDGDEVVVSLP
jgi:hypothetical protein